MCIFYSIYVCMCVYVCVCVCMCVNVCVHAGVWVCGVGVGGGDLRIQSWNVNSMKKSEKSWVQFVNKMKNATEEVFIIVDTRFEAEHETEFRKLWDGPIFFNSHSSVQRGIMVLIKDSFTGKDLELCNILKGNYSRLMFTMRGFKVLIKCCYAPNSDMAAFGSEIEGYSDVFLKLFSMTTTIQSLIYLSWLEILM